MTDSLNEIIDEIAKVLASQSGNHKANFRSPHYQRKAKTVYDTAIAAMGESKSVTGSAVGCKPASLESDGSSPSSPTNTDTLIQELENEILCEEIGGKKLECSTSFNGGLRTAISIVKGHARCEIPSSTLIESIARIVAGMDADLSDGGNPPKVKWRYCIPEARAIAELFQSEISDAGLCETYVEMGRTYCSVCHANIADYSDMKVHYDLHKPKQAQDDIPVVDGCPVVHQLFDKICDDMETAYGKDDDNSTFHDIGELRGYVHNSLAHYLARVPKREQREISVVKRFPNGRCEDLRLVQEIADAIISSILKQKPDIPGWRGEGTLDASNAVIDIMEEYFQEHSPKREQREMLLDKQVKANLEAVVRFEICNNGDLSNDSRCIDNCVAAIVRAVTPMFATPVREIGEDTLPKDVHIGSVMFKKGVKLDTLIDAATRWHKMASDASLVDIDVKAALSALTEIEGQS